MSGANNRSRFFLPLSLSVSLTHSLFLSLSHSLSLALSLSSLLSVSLIEVVLALLVLIINNIKTFIIHFTVFEWKWNREEYLPPARGALRSMKAKKRKNDRDFSERPWYALVLLSSDVKLLILVYSPPLHHHSVVSRYFICWPGNPHESGKKYRIQSVPLRGK